MITLLLHQLRLLRFVCGGHRQLTLENLALRRQLAVYKRTANGPKLQQTDRLPWVWLSRVWPACRIIVRGPACGAFFSLTALTERGDEHVHCGVRPHGGPNSWVKFQ